MQKQLFLPGSGRALQLFGSVELPAPIRCRKLAARGSNNGLRRGAAGSLGSSLVQPAPRLPALRDREEGARQVGSLASARDWSLAAWVSFFGRPCRRG